MATNTTNFSLVKPAYTDTADIMDINGNMDKVDTALQGLGTGLAIISKNNTHAAITAGQYVYVHGHGSLAEGLYTAKNNISANASLSTSNLTAVSNGGLNLLYNTLDDRISSDFSGMKVHFTVIGSDVTTVKMPVIANIGLLVVRRGSNTGLYTMDTTRLTHVGGDYSGITTDGNNSGQTLTITNPGTHRFMLMYL